jgi:hypothetical protein
VLLTGDIEAPASRTAALPARGLVVHRIWRSPWETKRALTAQRVWSARQRLLDAARESAPR